jgi:hypothetical protein
MAAVILSNSIVNANLDKVFDLSIWKKIYPGQYDVTSAGSKTTPIYKGNSATLKNPTLSGVDGSVLYAGSVVATFDSNGNMIGYSGTLSNPSATLTDATFKITGSSKITSFISPTGYLLGSGWHSLTLSKFGRSTHMCFK